MTFAQLDFCLLLRERQSRQGRVRHGMRSDVHTGASDEPLNPVARHRSVGIPRRGFTAGPVSDGGEDTLPGGRGEPLTLFPQPAIEGVSR